MNFDQQLLLLLNGSDSLFLDALMTTCTSALTWVPLYAALLYAVIKNNETMAQILLTVGCAAACVMITASVDNFLVKPLVQRPRPCNDPLFRYAVDAVFRLSEHDYSFFSAHAANTSSLAVFFMLLVRNKVLTITMLLWSLLNCYTRLYLGLHYPSDILCGLIFGAIIALVVYIFYLKAYLRISPELNYVSSHYTPTGYSISDIDLVIVVMSCCMIYALLRATIVAL